MGPRCAIAQARCGVARSLSSGDGIGRGVVLALLRPLNRTKGFAGCCCPRPSLVGIFLGKNSDLIVGAQAGSTICRKIGHHPLVSSVMRLRFGPNG